MGEDNWAEGLLFPYPSVFYGAIRSAFLTSDQDLIDSIGQSSDPTTKLQITGVFLAKSGRLYIPTPLDLVREKNDQEGKLFPISLINRTDARCFTGYPYDLIPFAEEDVEVVPDSFIPIDGLRRYFSSRGTIKLKQFSDFAQNESKIGVGLDRSTRASKQGKLFRVGMTRFNHKYNPKEKETDESYFVVSYRNLNAFPGKIVKLGAEGKVARIDNTLPIDLPSISEDVRQSKYFKLLLLTPAIFRKGSTPSIENLLSDIEVKLMAAFVGKPEAIGGWDLLNKRPKEMAKAVPAGSVYYYEIKSNHTVRDVENMLSETISISEGSQEQKKSGFGLFALVGWAPHKKEF